MSACHKLFSSQKVVRGGGSGIQVPEGFFWGGIIDFFSLNKEIKPGLSLFLDDIYYSPRPNKKTNGQVAWEKT